MDGLRAIGYGVINNKVKLLYNTKDTAVIGSSIKEAKMSGDRPFTVWLESHGATGWLFGESPSAQDEFKWTVKFAKFIGAVERVTGVNVDNIVLSGCFTANEFVNPEGLTYLNSPARILSLFLPGKNIVGFVGLNACVKVTNVFHKAPDGTFAPVVVPLEQAAILFKNGAVCESFHDVVNATPLYCNHKYTPDFIVKSCNLEMNADGKEATYYLPCLAQETVAREHQYIDPNAYGVKQLGFAAIALAKLESKLEPEPSAAAAAVAGGSS